MNNVFILQLDGVGGPILDDAMRHGRMPFVKQLLSEGWIKKDFFCGLPSTTPASQMGLLYGIDNLIPGFRYLMKQEKLVFNPLDSTSQPAIENEALQINPHPLTLGGTTVLSIFSAGAEKSVSFNAIYKRKDVGIFLLRFFRNPLRIFLFMIKIFIYLVIEQKGYKVSHDPAHPHTRHQRMMSILGGMIEQVIDGEMGMYFSTRAVQKKSPGIYVDFTGFDELSHTYGPKSIIAQDYLSLQDLFIKECFSAVAKSKVPYEFIILSDHGQVTTSPYSEKYGKDFSDAVHELYPNVKMYHTDSDNFAYDKIKDFELVCMNSGGLSLVYDIHGENRLLLDDFEKKYPDFAQKVSQLPSVGFVLARGKTGGIVISKGKRYAVSENDAPLYMPGVPENIRARCVVQLTKLLAMKYGADVYVFADTDADPYVGFELQHGSHGAIGNGQTTSFIMSKNMKVDEASVKDYASIYEAIHSFMRG